jgi:hypothetical protein
MSPNNGKWMKWDPRRPAVVTGRVGGAQRTTSTGGEETWRPCRFNSPGSSKREEATTIVGDGDRVWYQRRQGGEQLGGGSGVRPRH